MAVKTNLNSSLAKIVIKVVIFITNAIEIIEKLIIFIRYKASKLEIFRVTITGKVRKSIKVVGQQ